MDEDNYYEDEISGPSERDVDGVCELLRKHVREMTTATEHCPPVSALPLIRLRHTTLYDQTGIATSIASLVPRPSVSQANFMP